MKVDLLRRPGLQLDGIDAGAWFARVAEAFAARRLTVIAGHGEESVELDARAIGRGQSGQWPAWLLELLDDVANSPDLRELVIDARTGSDLAAIYEAPGAVARTIALPVENGVTKRLLQPPAAMFAAAQRSEASIDEARGGAFTRALAKELGRQPIEIALERAAQGRFVEDSFRSSGSRRPERIAPAATRALLIGNDRYDADDTLPGARRDVRTMAAALGRKGVPSVRRAHNLTAAAIERQATQLLESTPRGQRALLYFSGHGIDGDWVGVGGEQVSLRVGSFADALERARQRGVSVVVVTDACESGAAVDRALERRAQEAAADSALRTVYGVDPLDTRASPRLAATMRAKAALETAALTYADTLLDLQRTDADVALTRDAMLETLDQGRSALRLPAGAVTELEAAFAIVRAARTKLAALEDESDAARDAQENAREAVEQWLGQYGRALVARVRRKLDTDDLHDGE